MTERQIQPPRKETRAFKRIVGAMQEWVERDNPERIAMAFMGRNYTAAEMLDEVKEHTELGNNLVDYLRDCAMRFHRPAEFYIHYLPEDGEKSR